MHSGLGSFEESYSVVYYFETSVTRPAAIKEHGEVPTDIYVCISYIRVLFVMANLSMSRTFHENFNKASKLPF